LQIANTCGIVNVTQNAKSRSSRFTFFRE